jgi:hypothetical protein
VARSNFELKLIYLFDSSLVSFILKFLVAQGSGKFFFFSEPRTQKIQNRKDNDRKEDQVPVIYSW